MDQPDAIVVNNPWQQLRQFTAARIALGRTGVSLPTHPQLAFQLAHAKARDAVHLPLDVTQLALDIERLGVAPAASCLQLESAAGERLRYLQRPDLGRCLSEKSKNLLGALPQSATKPQYDMAFVIADGLSALAVAQNAAPFLAALTQRIKPENWSVAPVSIVSLGRVAVADEVAELLGARLVVLLIGERPGLSSPDSMGLYVTWMPRVGLNDAHRNCISNVRPAGLSYDDAAFKLHYLLSEMYKRQLSGVQLKDETAGNPDLVAVQRGNFLLG
ncbi:MAG: ethanolamine ammonia-lyase subunit EutC [Pseudomonadota bacterium]